MATRKEGKRDGSHSEAGVLEGLLVQVRRGSTGKENPAAREEEENVVKRPAHVSSVGVQILLCLRNNAR